MATKNIILPIALSSIDSATFTGSYQLLSAAAGVPFACTIIRIVNNSNRDITISYDGTTDHEFLQDTDSLKLEFQSNSQPSGMVSCLPVGTKIYVKGLVGGAGLVFLSGYYNPQGV